MVQLMGVCAEINEGVSCRVALRVACVKIASCASTNQAINMSIDIRYFVIYNVARGIQLGA